MKLLPSQKAIIHQNTSGISVKKSMCKFSKFILDPNIPKNFRFFKNASYQVLSLIFGIPLAAFWGLIFANGIINL